MTTNKTTSDQSFAGARWIALGAVAAAGLGAAAWMGAPISALAQQGGADAPLVEEDVLDPALDEASPREFRRGERGRRGERARARFERLDANGDGQVTQDEIDSRRAERFAEMDTSGDGFVSADELASFWIAQRAERWIARRDTDGDGLLSPEEQPMRGQRIMTFDLDEDGAVTQTEFRLGMRHLRAERRERHGGGHGRWRHGHGGGYGGGHGGGAQ